MAATAMPAVETWFPELGRDVLLADGDAMGLAGADVEVVLVTRVELVKLEEVGVGLDLEDVLEATDELEVIVEELVLLAAAEADFVNVDVDDAAVELAFVEAVE
jgi:hypothetical protein